MSGNEQKHRVPPPTPSKPDNNPSADRERNITTLRRLVDLVEDAAVAQTGAKDTPLTLSAGQETHWEISAQRGLLPGFDSNTPTLTAHFREDNNAVPSDHKTLETIQAHLITYFGKDGIVIIHSDYREEKPIHKWGDENVTVGTLEGLVDQYYLANWGQEDVGNTLALEELRKEQDLVEGTPDGFPPARINPLRQTGEVLYQSDQTI